MYVVDVLTKKFTIHDDEIQFVFQKNLRVEIDVIAVFSKMKCFEKIVDRWWFDDDHIDDLIDNVDNVSHEI